MKKRFKKKLVIGFLALTGLVFVFFVFNGKLLEKFSFYKYNNFIREDAENIFSDTDSENDALYSYVKKFGPKKTIQHLNELSNKFGSCHDVAHRTGRFAYEIYNAKSFKLCSSECHSGCYHGATEAYFRDHGTANLSQNLNLLCNSDLNGFFTHQCIHGIGHGLMAWNSYDLPEALKNCDMLKERQDSCWTGVFMENIVGGLTDKKSEHFTKYLSDDPLYPCLIVDNKYKSSCYFLQTSRMIQLFGADFNKVAETCLKTKQPYQASCFQSMGRDIGGNHRQDAEGAIVACSNAPSKYRLDCLGGAVQDSLWDPSGEDDALKFCHLLKDKEEKNYCYSIIFQRATEIFESKEDAKKFCLKAETDHQQDCLKQTQ